MLRPINAIIRDNVGNIIYRGFVVTGEVAVDNGDGSYDVYIAGEAKAYPKIFTLARNPDLAVGDKVRILYKNGDKNNPIIFPPVKPTAVSPLIYVLNQTYGEDGWLKQYDLDGTLLNTWDVPKNVYDYNSMCADNQNNVYITYGDSIVKRNVSGSIVLTKTGINFADSVAIGADGYLYTLETDNKVHKRDLSTLTSQSYITLTSGKSYCGLVLDSDNNIYTVNDTNDVVEKWTSTGSKIASHSISYAFSSSLGLAGDYLVRVSSAVGGHSYIIHKNLSSGEVVFSLTNIDYPYMVGSLSDRYLFIGTSYTDGNFYLEKYSLSKTLDWNIVVEDTEIYDYSGQVAAYPF